jgi:hypothetical protein
MTTTHISPHATIRARITFNTQLVYLIVPHGSLGHDGLDALFVLLVFCLHFSAPV